MGLLILILVLLLFPSSAIQQFQMEDSSEEIVQQLIPLFQNTPDINLVGIFNVGQYGDLINKVLVQSENLFNVYVTSSEETPLELPPSQAMDVLILFHTSLGAVDWLISVFHQQENFTPLKYSTKIILILTADEWITSQILTLSYLTTKNIFNVVTINLRQRNSSFLAYHPHSTNRMLSEIYSPLNLSQLFEDKAKNLNKSPLKVVQYSDLPFTGVGDGVVYGEAAFILMILERKLNATLTLTTHINAARVNDVHEMYSNGTDICLFSVQLTNDPYVIHGGQWTYPFTPVNTNILVLRKKATLCSFFVSLCDKASGVFLLAVLLIYLIYRASKRSNDPTATPLDIFGLVLLASLHFYPQRSLPSVILMNLSVLALIYVTIIQSSLTSFLISPESQQIETIRQFAEEGYKIYMQDHTNMFAMDEYPELFVNYTGPPMVGDTLLSNYFTMFPKMGTLCIERSFELFVKYSIPNYFHLIPEPVRRGWFVYKLPLNSPFYDCVNDVTFRIFEGGLSQYMRLSGYVASRISIPTIMPEMIEETVLLFHLDLAMFIVSFGLFASSLVFLVELQWAKRSALICTFFVKQSNK